MSELQTVRLSREFDAPIDAVYRAWTDPDQMSQWQKCGTDVVLHVESWKPETGAAYATVMEKPGEWKKRTTGRFLEVEPPRLLAYASDPDPEMGMPEMTVRVELAETETGTLLTLTHSGLPSEDMCGIVRGGWTGGLDQLADILARTSQTVPREAS